jgi:hypothetical protein
MLDEPIKRSLIHTAFMIKVNSQMPKSNRKYFEEDEPIRMARILLYKEKENENIIIIC